MKKQLIMALVMSAVALSACSNVTKEKLGLAKKAPNEFLVSTKAPLTMPPAADLNPIMPAPSVQPKITLENVSNAEAKFASKFVEPSSMARIDDISSAIDKELQRLGNKS